jgi:type IV fimbrial biogenesis protein FimT
VVLLCPRAIQRGFTLYEMVIVLTVAAILSAGVAGMVEWVERSRAVTRVNAVIADLSLARSEAIKRGDSVVACASKTGENCTKGTAWGEGYIIFVDDDGSERRETGEPLIRVRGPEPGLRLEYRGFGSHSYIVYQPSGTAANNGTFTICPRAGAGMARAVVISATGRVRSGTRSPAEAAKVCGKHNRT